MAEFRKSGGFGGDRENAGREFRRKDFGGSRGGFGGGNRGGFGGGRGGFGGRGGRDSGPKEMFPATCAECNKACQVPFRPSGEKPVYCSDCFGSKRDSEPRNDFRREPRNDFAPKRDFAPSTSAPTSDKRIDDLKKQLDAVNLKLDTLLDIMGKKVEKVTVSPKAVAPKKEEKKVVAKKPVSKKK